jgi:hypothetical protein
MYDIKICVRDPETGKWYVAQGGEEGSITNTWREIPESEVRFQDVRIEFPKGGVMTKTLQEHGSRS